MRRTTEVLINASLLPLLSSPFVVLYPWTLPVVIFATLLATLGLETLPATPLVQPGVISCCERIGKLLGRKEPVVTRFGVDDTATRLVEARWAWLKNAKHLRAMRQFYHIKVAKAPIAITRCLLLHLVLFVVLRPSCLFILRKEADALLHAPAPLHIDEISIYEIKGFLHLILQWLVEEMISKKLIPVSRMDTMGCAECGKKLVSTKGPSSSWVRCASCAYWMCASCVQEYAVCSSCGYGDRRFAVRATAQGHCADAEEDFIPGSLQLKLLTPSTKNTPPARATKSPRRRQSPRPAVKPDSPSQA